MYEEVINKEQNYSLNYRIKIDILTFLFWKMTVRICPLPQDLIIAI